MIKRFCTALLMLTGLSLPSVADDQTRENVYIVGVENIDHYPHYGLINGAWIGFGRDLLDAFANSQGYEFIYRPYPIKRLMQANIDGDIDLKFPDNPIWSSDLKAGTDIYYSDTFLEVIEGTMVTPENQGQGVDRVQTIGTIIGFTASSYLDLIAENKVIVDTSASSLSLIKKTIMNRIDGAYLSVDSAYFLLQHVLEKPNALVFDPTLPHDAYDFLLSSSTSPALIDEFNQFLQDEQELVADLTAKYNILILDHSAHDHRLEQATRPVNGVDNE